MKHSQEVGFSLLVDPTWTILGKLHSDMYDVLMLKLTLKITDFRLPDQ